MPTVPAKAGTHRVYLCLTQERPAQERPAQERPTQERPATAKGSGLIP